MSDRTRRDVLIFLGWEDCVTCKGSGSIAWCHLCKEQHRTVPPYIGCAVGDKPCPDCVDGLVPNCQQIEAARNILYPSIDGTPVADDVGWVETRAALAAALTPGDTEWNKR